VKGSTVPPCPACGEQYAESVRRPVTKDDVMLRRHRCRACGYLFMSAQVALTEEMADRVLEAIAL
jgi:uncharacterized Zn finger protein